jgi:hypothetical protein
MVLGFFAFATFCLAVALMLDRASIVVAFVIAFASALIVQLGLKAIISARAAKLVLPVRS